MTGRECNFGPLVMHLVIQYMNVSLSLVQCALLHALYLHCTCPHSLSMLHDAQHNNCSDEGGVMAASLGRGLQLYEWSMCSASELRTFRLWGGTECLMETDPANGIIKPSSPGQEFDLDYQCKAMFGDRATVCPWWSTSVSSHALHRVCAYVCMTVSLGFDV